MKKNKELIEILEREKAKPKSAQWNFETKNLENLKTNKKELVVQQPKLTKNLNLINSVR